VALAVGVDPQMLLALVVILGVVGLALLLRPWPFFLTLEESDSYRDRNVAVEFVKWVERQALARGLNVRGVARPVALECKKCGKASNYFVYPDEVCERCWRASLKPVSTPKEHHP
jgi:hypothetical protein